MNYYNKMSVNPSEHQAHPLKSEKEEVVEPTVIPATVASGEAPKDDTSKDKGMKTLGAFKCPMCNYIAKTEQGLKVHITRSHNEKEEQEVKKPEEEKVEETIETPEVAPEVAAEVKIEVKKEE